MVKDYTTHQNNKPILTSDKTFSSVITAASFCLGKNTHGWTEWKDKDVNTLDSVYRKQLEQNYIPPTNQVAIFMTTWLVKCQRQISSGSNLRIL